MYLDILVYVIICIGNNNIQHQKYYSLILYNHIRKKTYKKQMNNSEQYCKNHEQKIGSFFLSDQPWTKYCSECALNMALCGKRIDKILSQKQYDNKTQILSIIQRIKTTLHKLQPNKKLIDQIVIHIDSITKSQYIKIINNFNNYVYNLCQIRDQINQIYQNNISSTLQSYFQKQTKILLYQLELKENLEYIQGNYRSILENRCGNDRGDTIVDRMQKWNTTLINIQKILPFQKEVENVDQFLQQTKQKIKNKILQIQPFKFQSPQNTNQKHHTKITQPMITTQTINQQYKQNIIKTKLKLRSKSKYQTEKKIQFDRQKDRERQRQRQSIKVRKSIRDISNFQIMESFRI